MTYSLGAVNFMMNNSTSLWRVRGVIQKYKFDVINHEADSNYQTQLDLNQFFIFL